MKNLNETTTGNLFNSVGILKEAGDYAGKYQDEAYRLINELESIELEKDSWCDILHDSKGKCYAIYAEGELTCQNAKCLFVELGSEDCQTAYDEAQTHLF